MRFLPIRTYFLLSLSCLSGLFAFYTNEPAVSLLSVGFFAERFVAHDSEYRESVTNGEDVPANDSMAPIDEANQMPTKVLILRSGGCAKYNIPVKKEEGNDELFIMVKPGKKEDDHGRYNYKDKADITLTATTDTHINNTYCAVDSSDRSGEASEYCMMNITSFVSNTEIILGVELCVPEEEARSASLWELWVSPEHDSRRAKGTFEETGRQLFKDTKPWNTFLTMTSIVGKTGVGKSTVASFLAGNMSMFTTASSSDGTTTVGTDISPIIPISDYLTVLDEKLREGDIPFVPELYQPEIDRPLFFMDSEGMSFRGDEFDFITSGPAAIVGKSIVWITTDRMRPPDILDDIGDYMKGLDRISMGDNSGQDDKTQYGNFLIVLNKMQNDDTTDEEMLENLLGYDGNDDQMDTINKLEDKFEDVFVVGLPMVHVPEGEEFGYSVLPVRFREGLQKLANHALRGSETPRNVVVGNDLYEMNSTQASLIMSMLMDAANSGNIDLSDPCNVIYSIYQERVNQMILDADEEIETQLSSSCSQESTGILCTDCVCPYRTILVKEGKENMMDEIEHGKDVALNILSCKDESIADRISNLDRIVTEWYERNICKGHMSSNHASTIDESNMNNCDISQMKVEAHASIDRTCNYLFLCGSRTYQNSELNLIANKTFIDTSTKITITAPPKATNQVDGITGKNIRITIHDGLLTGSEKQITAELHGGDGNDGAVGTKGEDGADGKNGTKGYDGNNGHVGAKGANGKHNVYVPSCISCHDIYIEGVPSGDYHESNRCDYHGDNCQSIYCHKWECVGCCHQRTYKMEKDVTCNGVCDEEQNGKNGGNGGNGQDGKNGKNGEDGTDGGNGRDGGRGGNGGEAGHCVIEADVDVGCSESRFGGKAGRGGWGGDGGAGGKRGYGGPRGKGGKGAEGGNGGKASYADNEISSYSAIIYFKERPTCIWGGGWCSSSYPMEYYTCRSSDINQVAHGRGVSCRGTDGKKGKHGVDGRHGSQGHDGHDGNPGARGRDGADGQTPKNTKSYIQAVSLIVASTDTQDDKRA